MRDVPDKATNVPVLDQPRDAFRDVIQETHWVAQEIHRAQDSRCLAEQLLAKETKKSFPASSPRLTPRAQLPFTSTLWLFHSQ